MPSLKDLLSKTMLFTAAAPSDPYSSKLGKDDAIFIPAPGFSALTPAEQRAIWNFTHDASTPAKITGLTALVRPPLANGGADPAAGAMPMTVCTRIEALSVTVKPGWAPAPIKLPLTKDFVVAKFFLQSGNVPGTVPLNAGMTHPTSTPPGWWRLESNTDVSVLVVFAYELVQASGVDPNTVPLSALEKPGAFPSSGNDDTDPDWLDPAKFPQPPAAGTPGAPKTVETTVTVVPPAPWVIVAFGLTTCKQRSDFEPGEVLGAARVYPHVMVLCNQGLVEVEAKIAVERPATQPMKHDAEMEPDIHGILMTDTNDNRTNVPEPFPLPLWSNFFDYYDLNPATGVELTVVDPARSGRRFVTGAIQREHASVLGLGVRNPADIYESSTTFFKEPSQGDFDNLHLAPGMQFSDPSAGVSLSHIAMAPFCIHDCFHTHFRWGSLAGQSATYPSAVLGFVGRVPYSKIAKPLVPADQTVAIKMTSNSAFEYRAVQGGAIQPGRWSVFNHHGSAYAIEVTGTKKVGLARFTVATVAIQQLEPFTRPNGSFLPVLDRDIVSVNPTQSWAAFYQRLQFTGTASPDVWMPRIKFLNVTTCRTT